MNSLVLIVSDAFRLGSMIDIVRDAWSIADETSCHCVVFSAEKHVIFHEDPNIADEYGGDELAIVEPRIAEPRFLFVEFNDFDYGKQVLRKCVNQDLVYVDDDHGRICSGVEFATKCADCNFDWRCC